MPSAGSVTLSTTEALVFNAKVDGGKCTTFCVINPSTNTNNALVRIPTIHKDNEFYTIAPGEKEYFRLNNDGIGEVYIKSDSGTPSVRYGVVSKLVNV